MFQVTNTIVKKVHRVKQLLTATMRLFDDKDLQVEDELEMVNSDTN